MAGWLWEGMSSGSSGRVGGGLATSGSSGRVRGELAASGSSGRVGGELSASGSSGGVGGELAASGSSGRVGGELAASGSSRMVGGVLSASGSSGRVGGELVASGSSERVGGELAASGSSGRVGGELAGVCADSTSTSCCWSRARTSSALFSRSWTCAGVFCLVSGTAAGGEGEASGEMGRVCVGWGSSSCVPALAPGCIGGGFSGICCRLASSCCWSRARTASALALAGAFCPIAGVVAGLVPVKLASN